MFFLDHWKNLLLLTSPIRILVNYLRYDTYPFLDSHTLFKGYSLTNQINASCAPLGTWLVWEDKSSLWDTNDWLNESNTYEYLYFWTWTKGLKSFRFSCMNLNRKNHHSHVCEQQKSIPFQKKSRHVTSWYPTFPFFHYWREYYSIIQWREKQLKQSKAQNNWSKYLLNQQIEVKWHSLQETGHYDEPCWIEVKCLIQILTHIQPYRYTH